RADRGGEGVTGRERPDAARPPPPAADERAGADGQDRRSAADLVPAEDPRAAPCADRQQPAVVAGMARHAQRPPPRAAAGQRSIPRVHRAAGRLGRPGLLLPADVLSRPCRIVDCDHYLMRRQDQIEIAILTATWAAAIPAVDPRR